MQTKGQSCQEIVWWLWGCRWYFEGRCLTQLRRSDRLPLPEQWTQPRWRADSPNQLDLPFQKESLGRFLLSEWRNSPEICLANRQKANNYSFRIFCLALQLRRDLKNKLGLKNDSAIFKCLRWPPRMTQNCKRKQIFYFIHMWKNYKYNKAPNPYY